MGERLLAQDPAPKVVSGLQPRHGRKDLAIFLQQNFLPKTLPPGQAARDPSSVLTVLN